MTGFRTDAVPLPHPAADTRPDPAPLAPARVVIVDDRSAARTLLQGLLRSLGPDIAVASFADPLEALAAIADDPPDLVISDYRMPGLDGIAFMRRLHADPRLAEVPVVLVSVVEDRHVRREALESGACDFLVRPIDPLECRARCLNLLRLGRRQRALAARVAQLEREHAALTATLDGHAPPR